MRVTLGNSVTVARQTLTLFVGVRIPIPQPMQNPFSVESGFLFYNLPYVKEKNARMCVRYCISDIFHCYLKNYTKTTER